MRGATASEDLHHLNPCEIAWRMISVMIQRRTPAITTSLPNEASRVSTLNFSVACGRGGFSPFAARVFSHQFANSVSGMGKTPVARAIHT
jgi:hypothetical protein